MGRGGRAAKPAREAGLPPKFLYTPADGNKPAADYYVELNDKVQAVLKNVRPGEEQDLSARVARDGALVYPNRYIWCVALLAALGCYLLTLGGVAGVLLGLVPMYLCYDFYSGVLHVNLDDERNLCGLKSIILFQGCLEFQWHHAIPFDISRKDYLACCADLNVVVLVNAAANLAVMGLYRGPGACLVGLKLLFAYFGQYCHRSAHTPKHKRPALASALMRMQIMTPQEVHLNHHRPPHDQNFCLVGKCDPIVNGLLYLLGRNDWVWFSMWLFLTIFDVALVHKAMAYAFPAVFADEPYGLLHYLLE